MKEKVFLLLTAAMLAVSSSGCSKSSGSKESVEETTELETYAPLATVRERNIVELENFNYEIYDGRVMITKYKGSEANVIVPDEIEGQAVTEIGFYAFEADYGLETVTLPDTITAIRECAFTDCSSLWSINLPDGLTTIEKGAFTACTSLTSLTLPSSVTEVQEDAFVACEGLTSMTIFNPDLEYREWGLEDIPDLIIFAPNNSTVSEWAQKVGRYVDMEEG